MLKKIFGAIALTLGILLTLVGIGALIGNHWAESQVKQQLSQEKIEMPDDKGIAGIQDQACKDELGKYKGQQLETGDQAKAFADCYILEHMKKSSDGKTYSEVSGLSMKDKNNAELQELKQSLFMGDTLRGMLLNAYAWWTFAQIAKWVGIAAVVLGPLAALLGAFLVRGHRGEHAAPHRTGATATE